MSTTQQIPKSAPAATPAPSAAPAAEAPAAQKAIPAKLPARKVSSEIAAGKKVAVKIPAAKKLAAKAPPPQKAAPKTPLAKPLVAARPEKMAASHKARKDKLVRDSYTIPKAEYAVVDELKQRASKLGRPAKKSELLRAGIKILATLPDAALLAALAQVPTIKTGRPTLKR
jgi:hypothetical protein